MITEHKLEQKSPWEAVKVLSHAGTMKILHLLEHNKQQQLQTASRLFKNLSKENN